MSELSDFLEEQADLLASNISGWEEAVLRRLGKRINKYSRMSLADVKTINNIAIVKQDMKEIVKELAKITGWNISQIKRIYSEALEREHLKNKPLYDYLNKTFVPFSENKAMQAIVQEYSRITAETMLNLSMTKTMTVIDRYGNEIGLQRYYTDVLDKAVAQVGSGATHFYTAMRDAIVELGGSGIRNTFESGYRRRIDSSVRQNLLWGAKQASIAYNDMIGEELGCDGYEIDWHSFPRPSHEFMQGKQYCLGESRTILGKEFVGFDVPDPDSKDGLSANKALQDYGCLHYKTPIICGVSEPRYSPEELARLNDRNKRVFNINGKEMTGYEASQAMRRLETEIRKQKDIRTLARESGDILTSRECTARIKRYKEKYAEISDITGIAEQPKRMSTPRMPKTNDIGLTSAGNGGIIGEKENSPRKQKSADYSVSWDKVQSEEYSSRLSAVIGNDAARKSVETRARWALNNRDGSDTEELYAIRLSDGAEIGRITDQHLRKRIERTPEFTLKLNAADKAGEQIILIHNHPDGLPPSINDINALAENKNVAGITIGHDGSLYYYSRPIVPIDVDDWNIALKHFNKYSQNTAEENALRALSKKYGFEFLRL